MWGREPARERFSRFGLVLALAAALIGMALLAGVPLGAALAAWRRSQRAWRCRRGSPAASGRASPAGRGVGETTLRDQPRPASARLSSDAALP